jgi:hypothetical protein
MSDTMIERRLSCRPPNRVSVIRRRNELNPTSVRADLFRFDGLFLAFFLRVAPALFASHTVNRRKDTARSPRQVAAKSQHPDPEMTTSWPKNREDSRLALSADDFVRLFPSFGRRVRFLERLYVLFRLARGLDDLWFLLLDDLGL